MLALLCLFNCVEPAAAQRRKAPATQAGQGSTRRGGDSAAVRDAAALLQAGRLEDAEVAARGAIAAEPRDAEAHALLGVILDQRGRYEEAERELREAVRLDPRSAGALTNLGVLLVHTNRAGEAARLFEQALRINPEHGQAAYNLGMLQLAQKDYKAAVPLLERAAGVRNGRPATPPGGQRELPAVLALVTAYLGAGRTSDAAPLVEMVEAGGASDARALFSLGLALAEGSDYKRAARLFVRPNELPPNTYEVLFNLGVALSYLERFEESQRYLREAGTLQPHSGGVFLQLRR